MCYSTLLLNPWGNNPNYWVILGHPINFEGTNEAPLVKWVQLVMEGWYFQRCSDKRIWVCSFGDYKHLSRGLCDVSCFTPNEPSSGWNYTLFFPPNYFYATIYVLCLFIGLEIETVSQRLSCISKCYFKPRQSVFFSELGDFLTIPFFFFTWKISVHFSLTLWAFTLKITATILEREHFVFYLLGFS